MKRWLPLPLIVTLLLPAVLIFGQDSTAAPEQPPPQPVLYDYPAVGVRFLCPPGVRVVPETRPIAMPGAVAPAAGGLGGDGGPEPAAPPAPAAPRAGSPAGGLASAIGAAEAGGPAYEVSVQALSLPLKKEGLFGFTNHNLQKLREGLARGRIVGFPLNHQPFARVVRLPGDKERYALENFLLYETDVNEIRFDVALDLFHENKLIRIRVSAAAFAEPIIQNYLGRTFYKSGKRYRWTTEDHVGRFIQLARNEQDFAPVADWLRVRDALLESVELY